MIKARAKEVFVGGNLGAPFIGARGRGLGLGRDRDQQFSIGMGRRVSPAHRVMLNITEDHLDRYATFADYCAAKERMFAAQTGADVAILNRDDPQVWGMRERIKARVVSFGFTEVATRRFCHGRRNRLAR